MFYSIKGTLIHKEAEFAVVECGGVGFKCFTTLTTQRSLPSVGEKVMLYTYLSVKEDALDLYGFSTQNELNCYKMLTGVSGVGPKVGISILSCLSSEQVAISVAGGDYKTLTKASGVGPKLAQRIVLELRDKINGMAKESGGVVPFLNDTPQAGVVSAAGNAAEAVKALSVLGYTPADAASVVAKLDSALPVEELIRQALRTMAPKF